MQPDFAEYTRNKKFSCEDMFDSKNMHGILIIQKELENLKCCIDVVSAFGVLTRNVFSDVAILIPEQKKRPWLMVAAEVSSLVASFEVARLALK